jgi:hypothetical protein
MRSCVLLLLLAACSKEVETAPAASDTDTDTDTDSDADTDSDTDTDSGPAADPDVNSYIPDGYRSAAPTRVIYLGDSITAGYGVTSGEPYRDLLWANDSGMWPDYDSVDLTSSYPDLNELIDVSVPGATTDTLVAGQLPDLSARLGDSVSGETIVVLTIGGNDLQAAILTLLASSDPDAAAAELIDGVRDNMDTIVDYFDDSARFPDGAYVYIANVYDPTDGVGQAGSCFFGLDLSAYWGYFTDANNEIRDFAETRGVGMIYMAGHFMGHGMNYTDESLDHYDADDNTGWFASDCIHPNDRGHHEVRRLFWHTIDGSPLPLE